MSVALLGLGAIAALFLARKKKGVSGVGRVIESNYDGALITTKDGRHAVAFDVYGDGENGITVTAMTKTGQIDRDYMSDWEFWFHIGDYNTLSGAKRGAKRAMGKMGYELSDRDLNKI